MNWIKRSSFIAGFVGVVLGFVFLGTQGSSPGNSGLPKTIYLHNGTTFDSTTTTDTTGIQDLDEPYYITYSGYYTGGTSSTFTVYVLGNVGGTYIPIDDFQVTDNSYTDFVLRSTTLDSLGAVDKVKFATTMIIGDSLGTADLYYYANLQLR